MPTLLASNLDAIILLGVGMYCLIQATRRLNAREFESISRQQQRKILRFCGPLLLTCGFLELRFYSESPPTENAPLVFPAGPVASDAEAGTKGWRQCFSVDGKASAAFPDTPLSEYQSNERTNAFEKSSLTYTTSDQAIKLSLVVRPMGSGLLGKTNDDRWRMLRTLFASEGYSLRREWFIVMGGASGRAFDLTRDGSKLRHRVFMGFHGGRVYTATAISSDGHHDDEMIQRFTGSFRLWP